MKLSVATLMFCLCALPASAVIPASAEPVPPDLVHGSVLAVGKASITAPATYWKWYRDKGDSNTFVLANPMNDSEIPFQFWAFPPISDHPLDDHDMTEFLATVRKGLQKGLGKEVPLTNPTFEPSLGSLPGAKRFRAEILTSGPTLYVYGYAVQREQLWVTQCISKSMSEPSEFTTFASSLRLAPQDSSSSTLLSAFITVLVVAAVIFFVIRRKRAADPIQSSVATYRTSRR